MESRYTLNGTLLKRPLDFQIQRYRVTKSTRLANGDMSMKNIARKRKFILTYQIIDMAELEKILNEIWETNEVFYTFTYTENNVVKSAVVYSGDITDNLQRTNGYLQGGLWYWKDFTLTLIER